MNEKFGIFIKISQKPHWRYVKDSNCQSVGIGSDSGLAPNRRQVITWICDDQVN